MYKAKRLQLHKKVRRRVVGTISRPRVAVFKSHQHIYAQIIDDSQGKTLLAASDIKIKDGTKKEKAEKVGEDLAKKALAVKIKQVVFDRGGFKYHGRIASLAEGLRKGGLDL